MAKMVKRLTDLKVKRTTEPGAYPDGDGLYLQIRKTGSKDWYYRYEVDGKGRKKGLGAYPTISLEKAREAAQECRLLRKQGLDPIDYAVQIEKEAEIQAQLNKAKAKTFKQCAIDYIDTRKNEWTNAKHAYQWTQSLKSYAYPYFGDTPVQEVNVGLVVDALKPIWTTKTETATRVRQRVEAILDYATVLHYRQGENPARWKGHLDKILPKPSKVRTVIHHPAMPYSEVSEYFSKLRQKETMAAAALAFIILTATRSGEARCAKWDEIDIDAATWTIPPERMKARKLFRVPLSPSAMTILEQVEPLKMGGWVFPGLSGKTSVTEAAVRKLLKATHPELTTHGFRSTFRDWCAEQTNFPREIAEAALAHVLENKTEAAYQRGDLLERRRKLMEAWDRYLRSEQQDNEVQ